LGASSSEIRFCRETATSPARRATIQISRTPMAATSRSAWAPSGWVPHASISRTDASRRRSGTPRRFSTPASTDWTTAAGGAATSVDPAAAPMFWDSQIRSLEAQALEPIKALEEMRGTSYAEAVAVDVVVARLRAVPEYVRLFQDASGAGTSIDAPRLGQTIATFDRSLVAMDSPFDRFRAGDTAALTPQQRRGFETFDDVGCDRCHRGTMLSDFDLEAEGVGEHARLTEPDVGNGRFRFRTPSLRNVALTAPYMHNGTLATLDDVLRFYDNGRSENPNVANDVSKERRERDGGGVARLSRSFRRVDDMSEREIQGIIAFLESLSDSNFDRTIPAAVPSGLPAGGFIESH
jgi:cytochrome c peroxidase